MNDKEITQTLIAELGGQKNIQSFTHCATRLRLQLKDEGKADKNKIENIPSVISVVKAGGQYQVVFGPKVVDIFNEMSGLITTDSENSDVQKRGKKNIFNALIDFVSSVFTPILYVLIGSGIIKGLLAIFTSLNWMTATSGTYTILNAAGDSLYYFLPMFLAVTCARKLKTNIFVSLAIGGSLVYPNIVALYGKTTDFLNIPIEIATFKSSVFPIIFAIFSLKYLEKSMKKVIPSAVENIFAPLISLILLVPLTIILFGPLGSILSNGIASLYMNLYGLNKLVAGAFIGIFAQAMVVFGIHWGLFPIIFSDIQKYGFDTILAVFGPSIIAQSGAALGILMRTKDPAMKKISSSATIMGFFGISEPAIYGVTLKYKRAFLMAMIGGGLGGAIAGAAGSRATAVAVASVPSFPVYFGHGFLQFIVAYFVAFLVAAVLTYFFGFDKDVEKSGVVSGKVDIAAKPSNGENFESWEPLVIYSPINGEVKKLADVADKVFASGSLGKGLVVKPIRARQSVLSPVDGVVTVTYATKHAYGITADDGRQFLIHIGINTVDLNGKYFSNPIQKNKKIKKGEQLCIADFDEIEDKGYDSSVIITLINSTPATKIESIRTGHVSARDELANFID